MAYTLIMTNLGEGGGKVCEGGGREVGRVWASNSGLE